MRTYIAVPCFQVFRVFKCSVPFREIATAHTVCDVLSVIKSIGRNSEIQVIIYSIKRDFSAEVIVRGII